MCFKLNKFVQSEFSAGLQTVLTNYLKNVGKSFQHNKGQSKFQYFVPNYFLQIQTDDFYRYRMIPIFMREKNPSYGRHQLS